LIVRNKNQSLFIEKLEIPLMNNAIDDRYLINDQEQSKSPGRYSPNGKNKRLLTKDIMSGKAFYFLTPKLLRFFRGRTSR